MVSRKAGKADAGRSFIWCGVSGCGLAADRRWTCLAAQAVSSRSGCKRISLLPERSRLWRWHVADFNTAGKAGTAARSSVSERTEAAPGLGLVAENRAA